MCLHLEDADFFNVAGIRLQDDVNSSRECAKVGDKIVPSYH